jgi:hypothetical protein
VGFGDFYPRNDIERIFIIFVFIIGIRVFGFILNIFLEIINTTRMMGSELDDLDNLNRFLGILTQFNGGKPIKRDIVERIELYF